MADTQPEGQESAPPKPYAYGPGLLMVFGLGLLLLAAYCGSDLYYKAYAPSDSGKPLEWADSPVTILMNWGAMVASVGGAVYCFVLAVIRSKKASGGDAGAGSPPAA